MKDTQSAITELRKTLQELNAVMAENRKLRERLEQLEGKENNA